MATKQKMRIDPSKFYRAWQGAAIDADGEQFAFDRGTRLRGDHAAVKRLGAGAFVEDGTPENEWPSVFDDVIAMAEAASPPVPQAPPPRIDPATPLSALVACSRGILSSKAGTAREGAIHLADDAIVLAVPEAFMPLSERLDG